MLRWIFQVNDGCKMTEYEELEKPPHLKVNLLELTERSKKQSIDFSNFDFRDKIIWGSPKAILLNYI